MIKHVNAKRAPCSVNPGQQRSIPNTSGPFCPTILATLTKWLPLSKALPL